MRPESLSDRSADARRQSPYWAERGEISLIPGRFWLPGQECIACVWRGRPHGPSVAAGALKTPER